MVDPALAAATLAGGPSPLTGRERDVLVAARDGATVADIAGKLFLSEGTVRNYLSPRSRRPAPATASRRSGWPISAAGCNRIFAWCQETRWECLKGWNGLQQ